MSTALETGFDLWIKNYKENLNHRIRRLIELAIWDLYYGPIVDDDDDSPEDGVIYPGFVQATKEIKKALEDLEELWVDNETDEVMTKEPEPFFYQLKDENDDPVFDDNGEPVMIEESVSYTHYEISEVKKAILGKELSRYC